MSTPVETPLKLEWRQSPGTVAARSYGVELVCSYNETGQWDAILYGDDDDAVPFGQESLRLRVSTSYVHPNKHSAQLAAEALLERVRAWFAGERSAEQ